MTQTMTAAKNRSRTMKIKLTTMAITRPLQSENRLMSYIINWNIINQSEVSVIGWCFSETTQRFFLHQSELKQSVRLGSVWTESLEKIESLFSALAYNT